MKRKPTITTENLDPRQLKIKKFEGGYHPLIESDSSVEEEKLLNNQENGKVDSLSDINVGEILTLFQSLPQPYHNPGIESLQEKSLLSPKQRDNLYDIVEKFDSGLNIDDKSRF